MSGRGSLPPAPRWAYGQLESCGSCYLQGSPGRASATSRSSPNAEPACRRNPASGLDHAVAWRRVPTWSSKKMRTNRDDAGALLVYLLQLRRRSVHDREVPNRTIIKQVATEIGVRAQHDQPQATDTGPAGTPGDIDLDAIADALDRSGSRT